VLYVSALIPHVDTIQSGTLYTSARVAALDQGNPAQITFSMLASSPFAGNGAGVGPMVFDPVRRQLLMSGCYQRFPGGIGGEPASGKCAGFVSNTLRVLDVDAGSGAGVRIYDISINPSTGSTSGLLLAGGDPATNKPPNTLWATVRNPDALVEIDLPSTPSALPTIRRTISMPVSPSDLVRIPRPGASDLIAVAVSRSGLVLYDTGARQVIAQLEHLGDTPYNIRLLPSPAGTARLVVSDFGDCRLALIHVPLDRPWDAALRARAGTCP
jgi:hypothetical protein